MPKFSVPMNYIVWVDVEADDASDAIDKASEIQFTVEVSDGFEIEYNDYGTPYEYEEA